jgi:serine/threonine protein kinase
MMKIYITRSHYVRVGKDFSVESDYAIGSAGCVLKLESDTAAPLALKIPLLKATNLGENLLLCDLLRREWLSVNSVAKGRNQRLVKPEINCRDTVLCGQLAIDVPDELAHQRDGVLAIAFADDGKPMFINSAVVDVQAARAAVSADVTLGDDAAAGEAQATAPDASAADAVLEAIGLLAATEFAKQIKKEKSQTFYCLIGGDSQEKPAIKPLAHGAWSEKSLRPVFFNVPSVVYEWSPCNLQADVSTHLLQSASYLSKLQGISQTLEAIGSLHSAGVLHCDIRPANIFRSHREVKDANKGYSRREIESIIGSYALGDYGSLNEARPSEERGEGTFGRTLIGPAVAQLRTSPFYAPERRLAAEFEDANQATVTKIDGARLQVDLGWSAYSNIDDSLHERRRDALQDIRPGDTIRLRDYVFTILEMQPGNSQTVSLSFICDSTVAKIVHNRLSVVEVVDKSQSPFAISGYVIMRQWSRATDIFPVGILLLYLLFTSRESLSRLQIQRGTHARSRSVDTRFSQLLDTICAIPYFRAFWRPLSLFTAHMFSSRDKGVSVLDRGSINQIDNTPIDIKEYARKYTNDLCSSCPYLDAIFYSLGRNTGRFLVAIWFAMACIHRAEDFEDKRSLDEAPTSKAKPDTNDNGTLASRSVREAGRYGRPFCASRVDEWTVGEKDVDSGQHELEADDAKEILEEIHEIDSSLQHLAGFQLDSVVGFTLESDYQIGLLKNKLEEELLNVEENLVSVRKRAEVAETSRAELMETLKTLNKALTDARNELDEARNGLESLSQFREDLLVVVDEAKKATMGGKGAALTKLINAASARVRR